MSNIEEACKDLATARKFVKDVDKLAKKYDANYFIVTDGASGTSNKGNPAVKNARDAQIKWKKENGFDPDEDWSNESYFPNTEYMESLEESIIKNADDIYYNKDKFDSGEINLCFITGHSGSGKSTMGRGMAGDRIEHYDLDDVVMNKTRYTMKDLKEYGDLIYSFFNGTGKKYYYTKEDVDNGKAKSIDKYYEMIIKDFVKYSMSYAKSHKNIKFVVEGLWLLGYIEPSTLKDYAVYIKGTSLLVSTIRAANRDSKWEESQGNNRILAWIERVSYIKGFASGEKDLVKYQKYFSKLSSANESYIHEQNKLPENIPDDIKDLLKQLNSYKYGYVKNGKPINGMKNFFEDYKSLSISEFEKYKIGVCWDYVHYEANWFRNHGYKYETFYIQVQDEDNDCPSHTYLVFYLPDSKGVYYFESSWGKYQGIEQFRNITELHNTVKKRHIESAQSKCVPKSYFREKYDAASKSWEHLSCGEYMVKISKGRIKLDESFIEEAKRSELDTEVFGIPELRKYPMPDEKHVLSAIRFFNYVEPKYEKELARNIKKKMKQYNIPYSKVGEKNRLKKYLKDDSDIVKEMVFNSFEDTKPVLVFDMGDVLVSEKMPFTEALYRKLLLGKPTSYAQEIEAHIIHNIKTVPRLHYDGCSDYIKYMTDTAPEKFKKYLPAAIKLNSDNFMKLPYTESLLKELKSKGYKLYYLSNWSREGRDRLIKNKVFDFLNYFDGGVFSCDVKASKPDHKIYEIFFNKYNLDPKHCIFFDDNYDNVRASMECGMNAILFNKDYTPQYIKDNFL